MTVKLKQKTKAKPLPPMGPAHRRLFLLGKVDECGKSIAKATPPVKAKPKLPRRDPVEAKRDHDIGLWRKHLKINDAPEVGGGDANQRQSTISQERAVAAFRRGHKQI